MAGPPIGGPRGRHGAIFGDDPMNRLMLCASAALTLGLAAPGPAAAADPPKGIVSIYRVATGQQVGFLKWLANQDQMVAAVGAPKSQLYVHTDGDSWDYVVFVPARTDAQDKAIDDATRRAGMNPMRGGLEMRKYVASHTDTFVMGPMSAADYLALVGER